MAKKKGDAEQQVEAYLREFQKEFLKRLKRRTPVLTGQARDGWESQLNTDNTVTFTNDVPYIGKLENGSSTQAPNGMLKVTVEEAPQIAKLAAARVQKKNKKL